MTRLTGDALLSAIDGEAWRAANRADVAKADARRIGQAALLERAVVFWRDIYDLMTSGQPLSTDQQAAVSWLAGEGRKRMWAS